MEGMKGKNTTTRKGGTSQSANPSSAQQKLTRQPDFSGISGAFDFDDPSLSADIASY